MDHDRAGLQEDVWVWDAGQAFLEELVPKKCLREQLQRG